MWFKEKDIKNNELQVVFLPFSSVKRESAPTPPPSLPKPALTEEEVEKKSHAIIEEYLHINDVKVKTCL